MLTHMKVSVLKLDGRGANGTIQPFVSVSLKAVGLVSSMDSTTDFMVN